MLFPKIFAPRPWIERFTDDVLSGEKATAKMKEAAH
jgi:hypothetical protein